MKGTVTKRIRRIVSCALSVGLVFMMPTALAFADSSVDYRDAKVGGDGTVTER